ncbi:MAG: hypothetical protein PHR61_05010 [Candidatus Absconditabacteria bacterium]|nr:hypothetical protein [Candidatus Absconditabacteria bacterium]
MTFVVNTIKQDSKETKKPQNIQFLLDLSSPLFARKFIEESSLVLLSLGDYSGDLNSFGPLYVIVSFEAKEIRVVSTKDFNLKSFVLLFLGLGFDVIDGNYFVDPQTPEQIKKVIDVCKKELEIQQESQKDAAKEEQEKEKKFYYQDDGLEKAKNVIAWSLDKVNSLLVDKGAFISAKDLRTIKIKVEELKKMRMGTNYEKIRDMLQELFSIVDRIEEDYYASLEDSSEKLFDGTSVTAVDLERQVSILEKVQQQQMFGGNVSVKRKDYVAFGEVLIYLMFLKKDFIELFQKILLYVYRIFDFMQLGLIIILVFLGGSVVYFLLLSSSKWLDNIYYSFFTLGFLGLLSFLFSYIKSKNPLLIGVLFVVMIVLYFVGIPILKHTFALS